MAYEVVVDLTGLDADLQELTPNDFPVLIVYAIAVDPWAWSWNIAGVRGLLPVWTAKRL